MLVSLVAALVFADEPAAAATLTRGPYLQLLTTDSVTVVWNTNTPATCGLSIGPLGGAGTVIGGANANVCAIAVDGLTPGTQYGYVPLADGVPLTSESIFRSDDPTSPYRFLVVGDTGDGSANQLAVRDHMRATPADFMLSTGDMIYDTGAAADFDPKFFMPYQDLLRRLVFWPVLGNHDVQTLSGAPWRAAFYTPANNAAGSENYYSFDYGNAHVVVLDSNTSTSPGGAQHTFLAQDLAASTAVWKFVAFHHTIYSSSPNHGSNTTIRANLVPLFDQHSVDIVFMGHEHDYERTRPMVNSTVVSENAGTVYITTGGGGRSLVPSGTSGFTAYSESAHHFTRVVVDGTTLVAQMIRVDGTVRDSVTLVKGSPPPPPSCGDDLVNQPGEECDGADHLACAGGCNPDCTCEPVCGDGQLDAPDEECDGSADAACPGFCLVDCRCGDATHFVTLGPVADTHIESGVEATWDHGLAQQLDVDQSPVDITYLKFDLSGVAAPVARATLTLFCTNPSPDGGSVHRVGSSSWSEGSRDGSSSASAGGPGLKWTQVDTSGDGRIDALDTSPYVPIPPVIRSFGPVAMGQSRTVDVTAAFQAGPTLASVAIVNGSTDGAGYSSRNHPTVGQRPLLRLELTLPTSSTTTSAPTTSTTTALTTSTITATTAEPSTTTTETATTSTEPPASSTTTTTSETTTSSTADTTSTTSEPSTTITSSTTTSTTTTTTTTTSTTSTTTSVTIPPPTTITTTSVTTSSTTSTTTTTLPPPQSLQIPIAVGSNDAEESSSGVVNLTSTDLELVQESTTQTVGMRFAPVAIPRAATIDLAHVQFQVDEAGSGTTNLTITGQNVGNAPAFGTSSGNISSRSRTGAVSWPNVPAWSTVGARGVAQQTADIKTILQQIVNRVDWASGNAIVIIIQGTGKRVAQAHDLGQGGAPTLVVQFRTSGTPPPVTTTTTTTPTSTTASPTTATTSATTSTTTTLATTPTSSSTTTSTSPTSTTIPPAGTVSIYQAGVSGPAGSANIDTNIRLSAASTNYGTDPSLYVGVTNGRTKVYRTFLAFRLSGIPAGATVTACTLRVNVTQRTSPTAGHVRRLCGEHWLDGDGQGEAQATWNNWKSGSAWTVPGAGSTASCAAGGDYTTTGEVAYTPPAGTGLFTFPSLVALCQDAISQRDGWLRLRISQNSEATQSTLIRFDSSEVSTASSRPRLSVTWFLPPS